MYIKQIISTLIITVFLISNGFSSSKREFRAFWVATVNNIDWPSAPGLSTEQQKKEALEIINRQSKNGFNAIIFQVRPAADTFYPSNLEPWSIYLNGTQGKAPEPFYDPLQFWIEECHKRGMEFHAWLNPFRISQKEDQPLASNHIAFKHPEWIINYGKRLYFDPGIPEARKFVVKVVEDIVSRYDIDAIHFDDYFYPYPLSEEFPDEQSFAKYGKEYSSDRKADWRRANVDNLIIELSVNIKKIKPWVKFGISPFGVWRNKSNDINGSNTKAGFTNYDDLYADVTKWTEKGWIDYLLPQIYWRLGHPAAEFEHLCHWWADHSNNRELYVGLALYKSSETSSIPEWREADQIPKQIEIARQIPQIHGFSFYSYNHFERNPFDLEETLQNETFKKRALIPTMPWIDNKPPMAPHHFKKKGTKLKWKAEKSNNEMDKAKLFIVYLNPIEKKFDKEDTDNIFVITKNSEIEFVPNTKKQRKKYELRISALDRLQNESSISKPKIIKL